MYLKCVRGMFLGSAMQLYISLMRCRLSVIAEVLVTYLKCFETVGWATGRAVKNWLLVCCW